MSGPAPADGVAYDGICPLRRSFFLRSVSHVRVRAPPQPIRHPGTGAPRPGGSVANLRGARAAGGRRVVRVPSFQRAAPVELPGHARFPFLASSCALRLHAHGPHEMLLDACRARPHMRTCRYGGTGRARSVQTSGGTASGGGAEFSTYRGTRPTYLVMGEREHGCTGDVEKAPRLQLHYQPSSTRAGLRNAVLCFRPAQRTRPH